MTRAYGPCDFWLRRTALEADLAAATSSAPPVDVDDECDNEFVLVAWPHSDRSDDDGTKNMLPTQNAQAQASTLVNSSTLVNTGSPEIVGEVTDVARALPDPAFETMMHHKLSKLARKLVKEDRQGEHEARMEKIRTDHEARMRAMDVRMGINAMRHQAGMRELDRETRAVKERCRRSLAKVVPPEGLKDRKEGNAR